jgi:hypothetical protein
MTSLQKEISERNDMRKYGISFLCLLPLFASGQLMALDVGGRVSETVNVRYAGDRGFMKQESWLRLDLRSDTERVRFFSTLDVRYDPLFDTGEVIDLHEAYVKLRMGPLDLRIGQQVVVWGKADEFNPTDFINPEDYREFLSLGKADRKIGIFYPKVDYYLGDFKLEFLVIPFFTPSEIPVDTANPWTLRQLRDLYHDPRIRVGESDRPESVLENAEYAARFGAALSGFDFSFCVYSGTSDLPVMVRTGFIPPDTVIITPTYERYQALGFDFATVLRGWGVRGECAFIPEGFYETTDLSDMDGVEESPSLSFVLGTDRSFGGELYLNLQWIERILFAYKEGMKEDRIVNRFVASASRSLFYDELEIGFSAMVYKATDRDYLFHPYCSYSPAEGVSVESGLYLFGGPGESLFGQFDANDCVSLGVSFCF